MVATKSVNMWRIMKNNLVATKSVNVWRIPKNNLVATRLFSFLVFFSFKDLVAIKSFHAKLRGMIWWPPYCLTLNCEQPSGYHIFKRGKKTWFGGHQIIFCNLMLKNIMATGSPSTRKENLVATRLVGLPTTNCKKQFGGH